MIFAVILLLAATLVFGLLLRRETVRYPRMVATLIALDISICALAAVTTWVVVMTVWPG